MLKKNITQISSGINTNIEKSDRKINKIPTLDFYKIKERLLESIFDSINEKGKIENPS